MNQPQWNGPCHPYTHPSGVANTASPLCNERNLHMVRLNFFYGSFPFSSFLSLEIVWFDRMLFFLRPSFNCLTSVVFSFSVSNVTVLSFLSVSIRG